MRFDGYSAGHVSWLDVAMHRLPGLNGSSGAGAGIFPGGHDAATTLGIAAQSLALPPHLNGRGGSTVRGVQGAPTGFASVSLPYIVEGHPFLFSGALVTESVFTWPGMGRLFVDSLGYRDYPVLMGVLVVTAFLVIVGNLLADLVVAVVDPRIRPS